MSTTEKHRLELHRRVDNNIFEEFLKERDTERNEIQRTVVHLIFQDVLYTIESYEGFAILRVSTHNEEDKVNIPEWFGENTDISEEPKYFSYNLSNPAFSA